VGSVESVGGSPSTKEEGARERGGHGKRLKGGIAIAHFSSTNLANPIALARL